MGVLHLDLCNLLREEVARMTRALALLALLLTGCASVPAMECLDETGALVRCTDE